MKAYSGIKYQSTTCCWLPQKIISVLRMIEGHQPFVTNQQNKSSANVTSYSYRDFTRSKWSLLSSTDGPINIPKYLWDRKPIFGSWLWYHSNIAASFQQYAAIQQSVSVFYYTDPEPRVQHRASGGTSTVMCQLNSTSMLRKYQTVCRVQKSTKYRIRLDFPFQVWLINWKQYQMQYLTWMGHNLIKHFWHKIGSKWKITSYISKVTTATTLWIMLEVMWQQCSIVLSEMFIVA